MKTMVLAGLLLLIAVQAGAQFVCINDEGNLYFSRDSSGICQRTEHLTGAPKTLADAVEANDEKAELKVRVAELEAKLRDLEDVFASFARAQIIVNNSVSRTFEIIEERVK